MKRVLAIIAVLAVVAAGGVAAFWYVNQGEARQQILKALAELERAGVTTTYEELSITGFPLSYGGRFQNLRAEVPARGMTLDMPTATASMSVTSIGTVEFTLPETFMVTLTEGDAAGEQLRVQSEALIATVTPGDANAYDLGLTADRLRLTPPGAANDEHIEFTKLSASGALAVDRQQHTGSIDAKFLADAVALSAGGPEDGSLDIAKLAGGVNGDASGLSLTLGAGELRLGAGEAGEVRANEFDMSLKATPKTHFDLSGLVVDELDQGSLHRVVETAAAGVANGGAFDAEIVFRNLAADLAGEIEGQSQAVSLSADNLRYRADVNPSLIGVAIGSEKLKMNVTGAEAFIYDINDMDISLKTQSDGAFDLSPLIGLETSDERAAAAIAIIRDAIAGGGNASLRFASSGYESDAEMNLPDVPIERLRGTSGANQTELTLTSDKVELQARGDTLRYELVGPLSGVAEVNAVTLESAFPLKSSDDPQPAHVLYDIDTVKLDDQLLAMVDPEALLPREGRGVRIDVDLGMWVYEDLLDAPASFASPPVVVENATLKEALIDLLGFQAEATGTLALEEAPMQGEAQVKLRDWAGFLEKVSATPIGQDPQAQLFALMANGWLTEFGAPGDEPDVTKLDIVLNGDDVTINGKPLNPQPEAPAPGGQTAPGVAPEADGSIEAAPDANGQGNDGVFQNDAADPAEAQQ